MSRSKLVQRKGGVLVIALLLLALVSAPFALGASGNVGEVAIGTVGGGAVKLIKGRMKVSGPFVPGQPASVSVGRMPKRAQLIVVVSPAQDSPQCKGSGLFCFPNFVSPDFNSGGFKLGHTSGRGRALVTFTMPSEYQTVPLSDLRKLRKLHPQTQQYQDQQPVDVLATALRKIHHGEEVAGLARALTFVEIPPPPVP